MLLKSSICFPALTTGCAAGVAQHDHEVKGHRQLSVTDSVIIGTLLSAYHVIDTRRGVGDTKEKRKFLLPWSLDPSGRDKCMRR